MKIQEKDLYHGAALTQIVEHDSFKALNKGSEKYGHYLINQNRNIFIKHTKNPESPWSFTFQPDDLEFLRNLHEQEGAYLFLCLVCGSSTVCALSGKEIKQILDLCSKNVAWVKVEVPPHGQCHVKGSNGEAGKAIPHRAFPDKLFL
ncbi:hypothetical protein [Parachitinimonas caeni]|uniref:Uncharacterized protein n=1 Tax=Parachitinimonas caeni TaxID=3031301 RepID=A0ABT7DZ28_9NEIS|nr:hypothetical protein [Parachitinimonas caeni]MDK2124328.1 hypothetical protein [Parachitinimonas caeni]